MYNDKNFYKTEDGRYINLNQINWMKQDINFYYIYFVDYVLSISEYDFYNILNLKGVFDPDEYK